MPRFTLEDIQRTADEKYGPFVLALPDGEIVIPNAVRLSKEQRQETTRLLKVVNDPDSAEDSEAQERAFDDLLVAIAGYECAERIRHHFNDDRAMLVVMIEAWAEGSQAGEASPSQS